MNKYLLIIISFALSIGATKSFGQVPTLGVAGTFALFSTNGAVSNTGLSLVTGNVGTNNGSSTNFGNVDGIMHDANGTTATAAANLNTAYLQLNSAIPTFFPAPLLGNGQTLNSGVYSIGQTASLNGNLILDGQNNPNAFFIIQIQGAFSSAANSQVQLINGALACRVFWKIEGAVSLAANTMFKGTLVVNNAAIVLATGVIIEGRALTTTGALTISGSTIVTPLGCGTPILTGPTAPTLGTVACYTIFSANGQVTNAGTTFVTGDVGTNVGVTTGFQAQNVTGTIHPIPDTSTAQCASDLNTVNSYLSTVPTDIQLLYPASFGNNLVLTPHTYLLDAATVLTGTVFLNAQNNPNAVFVIKINGALSTSTFANVVLQNQAKPENVFWRVVGAVNLNDFATFKGTLICNSGAMILNNGVNIQGRALTVNGGVSTFAINATMTPGCGNLGINLNDKKENIIIYPNPFDSELTILDNNFNGNSELYIYNSLGKLVLQTTLTQSLSTFQLDLPSGMYIYNLVNDNGSQKTGKLISK